MKWSLLLFAVLAGAMNAVQSGTNTRLNKALEAPGWAVAVVGCVTMLSGVAYALASGARVPTRGAIAEGPWWMWIGGALGATFVLAMLLVASKVGAGLFTALTVTASVVTSLLLDHFGLVGFPVHQAGWGRAAGAVLMIAGLGLIAKF